MNDFERALRIVRDMAITFTCSAFCYILFQAAQGISEIKAVVP